jgi:hypothetical protein
VDTGIYRSGIYRKKYIYSLLFAGFRFGMISISGARTKVCNCNLLFEGDRREEWCEWKLEDENEIGKRGGEEEGEGEGFGTPPCLGWHFGGI